MLPDQSTQQHPDEAQLLEEPSGGFLSGFANSINKWVSNFVTYHTTTEWLVGLAIILIWAVVAFAPIGPIAALAAVTFAIVMHYVAMETGSYVWLWMATTVMLLFVIVAYASVLGSLGPIALSVGGAMALIYNETIRLNYNRRRDAVVDPAVFAGSVIATSLAAVVGIAGIGLSVLLANQGERSWVWMPATVLTLMVVAYAVTLLPTRRATENHRHRWEPGTRIPPRPVGSSQSSTDGYPTAPSSAPLPPPPPNAPNPLPGTTQTGPR